MIRAGGALLLCSSIVAYCVMTLASTRAGAARTNCSVRTADGTGVSRKAAQFQIYETLLQATDWGVWAAWMADGTTPGYKVRPAKYKCQTGTGLGVTCRGQAMICKL